MTPMTFELVRDVFAWSIVLNLALLVYWFLLIAFAPGWVYRLHARWSMISRADFDRIHYRGMVYFKLAIFFVFVMPYLAMRIVF